jgi:hypothetical protein
VGRGIERETERETEGERERVSTHIWPPPSDVHPRTSIGNTGLGMLPLGVSRTSGLLVDWYIRLQGEGWWGEDVRRVKVGVGSEGVRAVAIEMRIELKTV